MNMKTFDISVLGASHVKKGTVCQDYSVSNSDNEWSYAIVCDGHGGDDYVRSNKGSEFGCKSAEFMINSMMGKISSEKFFSESDSLLRTLEQRIIKKWRETVEVHYRNKPFTDSELSRVSSKAYEKYKSGNIYSAYGTTLVAVVMTRDYWFGIQIGDGKLITVDRDGKFNQPVPENPKCFANATTSMCDKDAFENFRGCFSCDNPEGYNSEISNIPDIENKNHFVAYGRELPAAIIVSSDGIDNCFKEDEQMYNLYKTVLYSFGTSDFAEAENGLKHYLPTLSQKGSGDDLSVAAILDTDIIPELSIVKEYDMNKQKQIVVDAKRREQEANEAEKKIVAERVARQNKKLQGEIEQLKKDLKQVNVKFQKSEEENKNLDKALRMADAELNHCKREYDVIEKDYNSLRRDLCKASDSIKICHYCGMVVLNKSNFCMKCGKTVTEYRKYTEKKERPWSRRIPDYPDGHNNMNTYQDNIYDSINNVSDDDIIRKNTDIDVPIAEETKLRQERIQKISDKKHESSDENYQKKHRVSLEKVQKISDEYESDENDSLNEKTNADTESPNQETTENIQGNVFEDSEKSEEITVINEKAKTDTENPNQETTENIQGNVFEDSEKSDENTVVSEETNTDTENPNQETTENIPDNVFEDSEENKSDDNYDDDDDFVPKAIVDGILGDLN